MKRAVVLAALVGLVAVAPAWAQQGGISGRVIDAAAGEPVEGARVELLAPDGAVVGSVTTAADGRFQFTGLSPGRYSVVLSAIGYEPKRLDGVSVRAEPVPVGDVSLVSHAFRLNPVVVTASRVEERALDAPASAHTVDTREVRERPAATAVDHVRGTPGTDMVTTGLTQHNVVARGFNNVFSGALFVLTDHRWASVPSLRFNAYNLIPATDEDIERIELVLGPGSALYGPNTSNGVMHILTQSPLLIQGTTVSLTGGGRSGSSTDGREIFQGVLRHAGLVGEDVGYKVSAQYFRGRDWEYPDPVEEAARAAAIAGGADPATLRIGRRDFDAERVSGEARLDFRLGDESALILSGGATQLISSVELTGIGAAQADDWRYSYVQARLRHKRLFAQSYVNFSDAGDTYTLRDGGAITDNSLLYVGQLQHGLDLGDRQRFVYGADLIHTVPRTDGTITGRNEADDEITEVGAYVQSETSLGRLLDVVAAARLDRHNRVEDVVFSPRAGLVFKPVEGHNLRLTYNRAFSQPSSNNLFLDILSVPKGILPFAIRASGVPETGFSFLTAADRPECAIGLGDYCMRSGFAGPAVLPANAAILWDELLVALNVPAGIRAMLPEAEALARVPSVLRVLNTDPETRAAAPFLPFSVDELRNVEPLKPTITNTFEAGYKGLIGDRLLLGVDVYFTRVEDFTGPLRVETPNVFFDPVKLQAYLTEKLGPLVAAGQLPPAELEKLIRGLASIPVGTITPTETPGDPADIILTYRNFGEVELWGADVGAKLVATDFLSFSGSYSFISKEIFEKLDGIADISLNAPKHKGTVGVHYRNEPRGLAAELRGRFVDEFPVASGAYSGIVERYTLVDANVTYALPFSRRTEISLSGLNILDERHREMVGAPELGRLILLRLRQTF